MTLPDPTPTREDVSGSHGGTLTAGRNGVLRRRTWAVGQYLGVLSVLCLTLLLLTATQPQFLTMANFMTIAETNAVLLIVAVGLTFVMLVGGIDLSMGGMMALTSIGLWTMLAAGFPVPLAAAVAFLGAGLVGGLTNGLLIGRAGLSFLVVTIGTASVFRNLANVQAGGQSQTVYEYEALTALGNAEFAGLPALVWIGAAVFVAAFLILRYTGYGRMIYATGGNQEAARLAGIPTTGIRVSVYAISGALAGLAAVLDTSRLTSATPNAGMGIELTAGAAVLLGGTSFMGGRGSVVGSLLGVMFLGVLANGLTLAGISPFWGGVVSGTVLVVAIGIDRLRNRRGGG